MTPIKNSIISPIKNPFKLDLKNPFQMRDKGRRKGIALLVER